MDHRSFFLTRGSRSFGTGWKRPRMHWCSTLAIPRVDTLTEVKHHSQHGSRERRPYCLQDHHLPTAIRKVTQDPADVYGIIDRGQLTVGAWADMILFDPDTISITKMTQHFDLPADGERLLRQAPGLL